MSDNPYIYTGITPPVAMRAHAPLSCGIAYALVLAVCVLIARPASAQEKQILVRVDRMYGSTIHVDAGTDQGMAIRDTVDAYHDVSFVGSLRVVTAGSKESVLASVDDELVDVASALRQIAPGDYLYLKFASAPGNEVRALRRGRPLKNVSLELMVTGVYDTNIDHNDEPVASYGTVPATRIRLRDRVRNPIVTASYTIGRHSYSNTDRWDRVSHLATLDLEPELTDWLRPETSAEVSIRGSSEDRDISNQYRVDQAIEFRFTRSHRLAIYGGLLWKKFPDDPENDAFKPRVGITFQRRASGGRRWELDLRREWNEEESVSGEYDRWKVESSYRIPVSKLTDAKIEVEYRRKIYRERFVEIEDEDTLRRDHRWTLGASLSRSFLHNARIELDYKFETRDSNDPGKIYSAHLIMLGVGYRL